MNIHHSGMVAIVGRPNAGKSTLVNKIMGEKVAIVAPKPQTTRKRLCAVFNQDGIQMVLMDTPGFHTPKTKLGQYMLREVRDSLSGVDAVVLLVAPIPEVGRLEEELLADCRRQNAPVILCVNKIDTLSREILLPVIAAYEKVMNFHAILPLSAKTGDGVDKLTELLQPLMPEGGALFPEDMSTDQPERALISETIREKLLLCLDDEIPHGAAVTIEVLRERADGLVEIEAVITCEKDSHKGIIIGKQGAMLKKIGSMARRDLEEMYEGKVFLKLWVRVRDRWRDNPSQLANFGYSEQ